MNEERNYEGTSVPQGNDSTTDYNQNPYTEYGQSGYNTYAQPVQEPVKAKTGCATAALVFGIFALLTTLFFINYVFGALSILFAIIYLVKKADIKPKGKVITGLVFSIISLAISTTIWVNAYLYVVNTEVTDIIEDAAALMGEEIDGRQMMDDMIKESTGNAVDLKMVEDFVGGEVSVERVMNFMDGVNEEEIYTFVDKLQRVEVESIPKELQGEITYKKLEKLLGKDFTLRDIMEYVDENMTFSEVTPEDAAGQLDAAPAN